MRVLVMQDVSEAGLSELRGHELVRGSDPAGCDAAVCYLVDRIDEAFLATPGLRALATVSVGLDHIDLDAADRHRIPIAYTPDVLTEATADLTFALLLAAARRLGEAERYLRAGRWTVWSFDLLLGTDVHGKTLAVIGGGRIGRAVARRAEGFSMDVVMVGRDRGELEAALPRADFVVVTVPLSEQTRHLIGTDELALMKQGAILVNSSRGPVVDERGAGRGPAARATWAAPGWTCSSASRRSQPLLMECDNAVLVPHIGSATTETREGMARLACRGLAQILRGERPPNLANPQVWDQWAHRWA